MPGLGHIGGIEPGVGLGGIMTNILDVPNQMPLLVLGDSLSKRYTRFKSYLYC